ncbi:MAG: serine/threonine-protein phosphatase [Bacteroidales bacterium]|nr:serine/threonine-protein phosphatase [Bacteroidales bacterium]MCM1415585.1 serine/threonine-protein phosphatase [bacterium]MCM1423576.1 serine/threonine-protein phosphatase [bacterium]
MRYLTGVYWNRGSLSEKNQDAVLVQQVLTRRGRVLLAAVCDGMGGVSQGELAAAYAAERLQEWFYLEFLRMLASKKRIWAIRRSLDRLVWHMQQQMRRYGEKEGVSLGTTMTVLVMWEKAWILWHLGDSRIYRLRRGRIRQLTTDHACGAGKLTKCVGSFGDFVPEHMTGIPGAGDGFLLCSDGFRRQVTAGELGDVLAPEQMQDEAQIERRLREIGEACMKRGERDNLSAVYVKALP